LKGQRPFTFVVHLGNKGGGPGEKESGNDSEQRRSCLFFEKSSVSLLKRPDCMLTTGPQGSVLQLEATGLQFKRFGTSAKGGQIWGGLRGGGTFGRAVVNEEALLRLLPTSYLGTHRSRRT